MPASASSKAIAWRQAAATYCQESRRPLASLAFVLPLMALYEGGVVLLGSHAVRNGADVWLRGFLDSLGFGQYFLLPALTLGLLLAWHHTTHDRWQLSAGVLYVMIAECAALGLLLLGIGRLQGLLAEGTLIDPRSGPAIAMQVPFLVGRSAVLGRLLGFLGAGIYEEMLFRLLLVPPIAAGAARLGASPGLRTAGAVLLTSVVFAGAHYVGPYGDAFQAFSFTFRLTAGVFFALLFIYRGFGIAAGTHALYDIFVSLG